MPDTETTTAVSRTKFTWRRAHRWLYDWVIHWAETPYGGIALFLLAFAESSFFPIPPDVLLIVLVLGARQRWWRFALICTAGSVIGGAAGYWIGAGLMDTVGMAVVRFYKAEETYKHVQELYAKYDYWIVLTAAFTPIPYKIFTIASGAMEMDLTRFMLVSFFGRGARFFIVAVLLWLFGRPVREFIERYFDWLALLFVILLIGGFAALKLAS